MVRALIRISRFQTDLRTDDTKLVRIARKLSEVEPQVQKRNFPSVEQIQDSPAVDKFFIAFLTPKFRDLNEIHKPAVCNQCCKVPVFDI